MSKDGLVCLLVFRTVSTETNVLLGVPPFDVEVIPAMTGLPSDWAVDDVHRINIHDLKSRLREILSCRKQSKSSLGELVDKTSLAQKHLGVSTCRELTTHLTLKSFLS